MIKLVKLQEDEQIIQISAGRGGDGVPVLYALTSIGRVLRNDHTWWDGSNWEEVPAPEREEIH